jgi:putative Mn2+ efflux pump MntP
VLALLLVAVSVGASNFAAAVAIGVPGVDRRIRVRVGAVFGAFEAGMPIVGLFIGREAAGPLGHASRWLGGGLLIAVGGYALVSGIRSRNQHPDGLSTLNRTKRTTEADKLSGCQCSPTDDAGGVGAAGTAGAAGASATATGGTSSTAAGPPRSASHAIGTWRLLLSGLALSVDNLVVGFALGADGAPVLVGALVIGLVSVALSLIGLELGARIGRRAGDRGEQLAGLMLILVGAAIAAGALG